MAEYRSDEALNKLKIAISDSRREDSSPESLSRDIGTSTSEQPEVTVFVGRVNTQRRRPMNFGRDEKISHLTEKIQQDYSLRVEDDIIVYEQTEIPGSINKPINPLDKLDRYQNRALVFDVPGPAGLDEIKQYCCAQNIALYGGTNHEKSSFIETLIKALGTNLDAPPNQNHTRGTMAFTPYNIRLGKSASFTLLDVAFMPQEDIPPEQQETKTENIQTGNERKNVTIRSPIKLVSEGILKLHAAVYIQKGTEAVERLNSDVLKKSTRFGRAIPVFVVITNIDQMKPCDITAKEKEIATLVGIDQSNIFKIANYDHQTIPSEDPQRDFHARTILMKILAASKSYKREIGDAGDCNVI